MSGVESGDERYVREAMLLYEDGEDVLFVRLYRGDVATVWSRECVRYKIRLSLDIPNIRRHLGHA